MPSIIHSKRRSSVRSNAAVPPSRPPVTKPPRAAEVRAGRMAAAPPARLGLDRSKHGGTRLRRRDGAFTAIGVIRDGRDDISRCVRARLQS